MPDEFAAVTSFATARDRVNDHVRMSGLLADRPDAKSAIGAYFFATDENKVYESMGHGWERRGDITNDDYQGHMAGPDADRPPAAKMVGWLYCAEDTKINYEAFPGDKDDSEGIWFTQDTLDSDLQPENLEDTVGQLSGPGFAKLRSLLTPQFGIRLESTGDRATPDPLTQVIFQTLDASPKNPYLVIFDQFILEAFTGDGQFDLVERDSIRRVYDGESEGGTPHLASATMNWQPEDEGKLIQVGRNPGRFYAILSVEDEENVTLDANITLPSSELTLTMEGKNEVTIATKDGLTDGIGKNGSWSSFRQVITSDKVYLVVFVPGTAGDGIYSMSARQAVAGGL